MDAERVRTSAFAMPLTNPSYPPGHYRFVDGQYLIITYRSDPEAIGRVLPEPLEVTGPLVHLRVAHAAERHGDVRALAPAVDVQLVHHQERQLASHAQPGSMPDDAG